ncbi:phospholipid/cholesterol/gamma-HCH transport system substrate-binding protein [Nocardioides albertanoniae]|uniref:Phospholipid/cholesterol/gamma-HCH transport system substrate-binding protein n=1 Tax=Nocardioides albertanoniae TaxID=1175486 RepID=A0A543AD41_9ACTN|nr:MCE family protein [Nocardioides albertanoniae]TQL70498.1 phospholipid/cholesterol/gamma-HCH transport system substrate-binding protein [Nocardioides albertanoniae]
MTQTLTWSRQKGKVLGIIFIVLVLAALGLTWAQFTNKFAEFEKITLKADRIGLQLPERADVKVRGLIVGEVIDMKPTDGGAELTLGLFPDEVSKIHPDVTGAILPKTLFGQKYVSLIPPNTEFTDPIKPGAVIKKTKVATEVQAVLRDLYPLLRTIQPADLNNTLNALATALEGRGDKLGESLDTLDSYLKRLNPEIPALIEDLELATKVSGTYQAVLPELGQILRNTIVTATTLEDREDQLNKMLTDVTAFSNTADDFLDDNGDTLIQLGQVGRPVTKALARYAPMFPCLIGGMDTLTDEFSEVFRNYTVHITLETLPHQSRPYSTKDKPRYGEDSGPNCGELPNASWNQKKPFAPFPNKDDGVDEPTGKGVMRSATGPTDFSAMSYVGTSAETDVINELFAPGMGMSADEVPDLGALMLGPAARGAEVTYK